MQSVSLYFLPNFILMQGLLLVRNGYNGHYPVPAEVCFGAGSHIGLVGIQPEAVGPWLVAIHPLLGILAMGMNPYSWIDDRPCMM